MRRLELYEIKELVVRIATSKRWRLLPAFLRWGSPRRFCFSPTWTRASSETGCSPRPATASRGGRQRAAEGHAQGPQGLSIERRLKAIFWWCYMHSPEPLPATEMLRVMPTDRSIAEIYERLDERERLEGTIPRWGMRSCVRSSTGANPTGRTGTGRTHILSFNPAYIRVNAAYLGITFLTLRARPSGIEKGGRVGNWETRAARELMQKLLSSGPVCLPQMALLH